jgi:hypothetical protein
MNSFELTKKEKRILALVAKAYFPSGSFWCLIVLVVDGIAAIVFSVRDCLIASAMAEHENPETIMVLLESLLFLRLANIGLLSAVWLELSEHMECCCGRWRRNWIYVRKRKTD